jgi:hypothetical protein
MRTFRPHSKSSHPRLPEVPPVSIYRIDPGTSFAANTAFSSGQGTVLQTNTTTGVMTPIYVGMNNPRGLIFVME